MVSGYLNGRRALVLLATVIIVIAALLVPTLARGGASVNARDYGVVGDNVTDDTVAVLRACQAAASQNLPVTLPAGRIRLGSPLTIPAGVTLQGAGGKDDARTDASFSGTWLRGSIRFNSDVTVKNMKVGDVATSFSVAPAKYTTANVRFEGVRFRGGGPSFNGAIFAVNGGNIDGLHIDGCRFERNLGSWTSNGGAGALAMACDTGYGNVLKDIWITNSHFGVSNGIKTGQPTFNIVFWQSEEAGAGYWTDVHIVDNVFEATDEFNLDFDGLWARDNGGNVVYITGNLIKGAGIIRPDGSRPSWGYGICTEPTRNGSIIEGNTLYKGYLSAFKTTKDTTDTTFRNNTIDLTVPNGVTPYYADYFRTINLFDGARNRVTGNTIYLPIGAGVSPQVIYSAESTSTVYANSITSKSAAAVATPAPTPTLTVGPTATPSAVPTPTATLTVRPAAVATPTVVPTTAATPTVGPTPTPAVLPTPTTVPAPTASCAELSLNRPATALSSLRGYQARLANDGSTTTRWIARTTRYPQYWTVDLGSVARISNIKVAWSGGTSRVYAYKIRVSSDGRRFTTALDRSGNRTAGTTSDAVSAVGRYVRVTALGVQPAGCAASIIEMVVCGRR